MHFLEESNRSKGQLAALVVREALFNVPVNQTVHRPGASHYSFAWPHCHILLLFLGKKVFKVSEVSSPKLLARLQPRFYGVSPKRFGSFVTNQCVHAALAWANSSPVTGS